MPADHQTAHAEHRFIHFSAITVASKKSQARAWRKSEGLRSSGRRNCNATHPYTARFERLSHSERGIICGLRQSSSPACENRPFKIMRAIDSTTEARLVREPRVDNRVRPNLNEPRHQPPKPRTNTTNNPLQRKPRGTPAGPVGGFARFANFTRPVCAQGKHGVRAPSDIA